MSSHQDNNNPTDISAASIWMPMAISVAASIVAVTVMVKDVEAKAESARQRSDDTKSRVERLEDKIDSLMLITKENQVSLRKVEEDLSEVKRGMPRLKEAIRGRSD